MKKLNTLIAGLDPESASVLEKMLVPYKVFQVLEILHALDQLSKKVEKSPCDVLILNMEDETFPFQNELSNVIQQNPAIRIVALNAGNRQITEFSHLPILHYLFQPILEEGIQRLVEKFSIKGNSPLETGTPSDKIKLPIKNGYLYLKKEEILMLEAEGNYTCITTHENKEFMSSYNMGRLLNRLDSPVFFRVNRSCVINSEFLRKVDIKQRICFIQVDGAEKEIPVSQSFIAHFNKMHR